jgi:hypothetical protein
MSNRLTAPVLIREGVDTRRSTPAAFGGGAIIGVLGGLICPDHVSAASREHMALIYAQTSDGIGVMNADAAREVWIAAQQEHQAVV